MRSERERGWGRDGGIVLAVDMVPGGGMLGCCREMRFYFLQNK